MSVAVGGLLVVPLEPASAGGLYVVNSLADTNVCNTVTCTLRGAITAANATPGADLVRFSVNGAITLGSSSLPAITDSLTIDGTGHDVTIDAHQFARILTVNVGQNAFLIELTLVRGKAGNLLAGDIFGGGAIRNLGTLHLTRSLLSGNGATDFNHGGAVDNAGVLFVDSSTFTNNVSALGGGAIVNRLGAELTVTNTTFARNFALGAVGGAIENTGTGSIASSTFSGNSVEAPFNGAQDSTRGGALANTPTGTMTVRNSILANNTSFGASGNCHIPPGVSPQLLGPSVVDGGGNVSSDYSCPFGGTSLSGVDPLLGVLALNGGRTPTLALGAASPAIDVPSRTGCPATDQRGVLRPQGAGCDAGAFEGVGADAVPPDTTITSSPSNPSNQSGPSFTFTGTDAETGVAGFECELDITGFGPCQSPVSLAGVVDGVHTFRVRAIDFAANLDPTPASYTWRIDTIAPTVRVANAPGQVSPTTNSPILFRVEFSEPVTDFGVTDVGIFGTAGAANAVVTEIAPNDGTTYAVALTGMATTGTVFIEVTADRAFDAAGNGNTHSTSSDKGVDYVSDTTPPAITSTLVGTLGSAVWYRSSVVLTWTVTDNESPVLATGCGPLTSTADTTGAVATCTATSLGGTSTATVSFKIDRTAPSVAVTGPTNGANYPLGAVPLAACSTTDSTSGVATPASISVTGGNVDGTGSFTVNCAGAIDIAGNSASAATVSYTVFDGSANPDVLDSFNRADGPLGPDWSGAAGVIFNRVSAGRLLVQVGGPALWGRQSFGSSQSAAVTLTSLPSFGIGQSLLLKVQGDGTSIAVTYDARLRNVRVTTLRVGGVTLTTYPASGATFASSDRFGAAALSNGTIRIYRNGALLSTLTLSHTDQAYFNARGGKIGLLTSGIGNLLDNFSVATEPT